MLCNFGCESSSQVLFKTLDKSCLVRSFGGSVSAPHFSGKVLVIEDSAGCRKALSFLLRGCCDEIVTFERAECGLSYLRKSIDEVSLVLCDIELPCMSGIDFVESARAISDVPIILQSGVVSAYGYISLKFSGVVLLEKPYCGESLYMAIDDVVRACGRGSGYE